MHSPSDEWQSQHVVVKTRITFLKGSKSRVEQRSQAVIAILEKSNIVEIQNQDLKIKKTMRFPMLKKVNHDKLSHGFKQPIFHEASD